jgi:glycosyltransferase involved in cell wall biosynthesis
MKVVYLSPTYFDVKSVIGGGERYAYELAKAVSLYCDTELICFGDINSCEREGNLIRRILKPLLKVDSSFGPVSLSSLRYLWSADVVHSFHCRLFMTDSAIIMSRLLRKKVFVTDLGSGAKYSISNHIDLLALAHSILCISKFGESGFQAYNTKVIGAGINPQRFSESSFLREKKILFVGRLMPYKGIHTLIDAVDDWMPLTIVGRPYDQAYYQKLLHQSAGKKITFLTDVDDEQLLKEYRTSLVTVLTTEANKWAQLSALTLLESMACGTPVIGTRVDAIPEIIEDGITGYLVPPNDPDALRGKIKWFFENSDKALDMGKRGREKVLAQFTWDAVARRCLDIYQDDKQHNDR